MQRRRATGRPAMLLVALVALLSLFVMHGLGEGHGPGHLAARVLAHGAGDVGPAVEPGSGHAGENQVSVVPPSHPHTLQVVAAGLAPTDGHGSSRLAEMCLAVLPVLLLSLLAAVGSLANGRGTTLCGGSRVQTDRPGGARPASRHTPLYQLCVLRT